jgi:hypothetical protein
MKIVSFKNLLKEQFFGTKNVVNTSYGRAEQLAQRIQKNASEMGQHLQMNNGNSGMGDDDDDKLFNLNFEFSVDPSNPNHGVLGPLVLKGAFFLQRSGDQRVIKDQNDPNIVLKIEIQANANPGSLVGKRLLKRNAYIVKTRHNGFNQLLTPLGGDLDLNYTILKVRAISTTTTY